MTVPRPPTKITIETQDGDLWERLSETARERRPIDLLDKRWTVQAGSWSGFDRKGTMTLIEELDK